MILYAATLLDSFISSKVLCGVLRYSNFDTFKLLEAR